MASTPTAADCTVGRRERKKLATRLALHDAAMDLVEERGLAHVTVEDITEAADVSVRTFFNHFSSKEEAVLNPDPERLDRLIAAIAGRPAGEAPLEVLRRVVVDELFSGEHRADQMARRMRLVRSEPTLQAMLSTGFETLHTGIAGAIAERTGLDQATSAYPDLVAATAFAGCRVAMYRWIADGGRRPPAEVVGEVFDLLATGLTPPLTKTEEVLP